MQVNLTDSRTRLLSLYSDLATDQKHELEQIKFGVPQCSYPQNGEGSDAFLMRLNEDSIR